MIKNLKISNFIIVKELSIDFSEGMQVLTGETGAGKSIILGGLQLILGNPIKKGMLYDPQKPALLEATFSIDKDNKELIYLIQKYDIDDSEDEIFISKEISPENKVKSFLNGRRVTNTIIKEFRNVLLDFHSQRDQMLLLNEDYQMSLLDQYGDIDISNYKDSFLKYKKLLKVEQDLIEKERKDREKIDLYQYQIEEIEKADLSIDEEKNLIQEYNFLSNLEDIKLLFNEIQFDVFENDDAIISRFGKFKKKSEKYASDNDAIKNIFEVLEEILNSINALGAELSYLDSYTEFDEERYEYLNNRITFLTDIQRKYNLTIPEILEYKNEIEHYISSYSSLNNDIKSVSREIEITKKELINNADALLQDRMITAKKLQKEIESNLKKLSIQNAKFEIRISDRRQNPEDFSAYSVSGISDIEFYFSANKGVELQRVKDAASGGELSRILLAIKKILSNSIKNKTIIFDEIDSGVGGKTAEILGKFIQKISQNNQVIIISHLAQVASFADVHYKIKKNSDEEKTFVSIEKLEEKKRIDEIARMLSGSKSSLAIEHAKELIEKSRRI